MVLSEINLGEGAYCNFMHFAFFNVPVPLRASVFIAPREGYKMTSWSLETYVPPVTACPGKYAEQGCHFVFYARGFGEGSFTFWIELQVNR